MKTITIAGLFSATTVAILIGVNSVTEPKVTAPHISKVDNAVIKPTKAVSTAYQPLINKAVKPLVNEKALNIKPILNIEKPIKVKAKEAVIKENINSVKAVKKQPFKTEQVKTEKTKAPTAILITKTTKEINVKAVPITPIKIQNNQKIQNVIDNQLANTINQTNINKQKIAEDELVTAEVVELNKNQPSALTAMPEPVQIENIETDDTQNNNMEIMTESNNPSLEQEKMMKQRINAFQNRGGWGNDSSQDSMLMRNMEMGVFKKM